MTILFICFLKNQKGLQENLLKYSFKGTHFLRTHNLNITTYKALIIYSINIILNKFTKDFNFPNVRSYKVHARIKVLSSYKTITTLKVFIRISIQNANCWLRLFFSRVLQMTDKITTNKIHF